MVHHTVVEKLEHYFVRFPAEKSLRQSEKNIRNLLTIDYESNLFFFVYTTNLGKNSTPAS